MRSIYMTTYISYIHEISIIIYIYIYKMTTTLKDIYRPYYLWVIIYGRELLRQSCITAVTGKNVSSAVREAGVSRHHGERIKGPLKPLNVIVLKAYWINWDPLKPFNTTEYYARDLRGAFSRFPMIAYLYINTLYIFIRYLFRDSQVLWYKKFLRILRKF